MNFKFLFNNVRFLYKYFFDIKVDFNVLSVDIIGIVEFRFCEFDIDEKYLLDGFKIFCNDGKIDYCLRLYYGIVLYVKSNLIVLLYNLFFSDFIEFFVINVIILNFEVQCVVFYKKFLCYFQVFCKILENKLLLFMQNNVKIVIMGDFNLDLISKCYENFLKFMKEKFSCN